MDGKSGPSAREDIYTNGPVTGQVSIHGDDPVGALAQALGSGPFALICLFVSSHADFDAIVSQASDRFAGTQVVACSTAGELGADGYCDEQIVATAFPATLFTATPVCIANLDLIDSRYEIDRLIRARVDLSRVSHRQPHEFAFLVVDGLSLREDALAMTVASGLGPMPMFGGSAGDGTRFERTLVALNGKVMQNATVVTLIRSACPVKVFTLDHLVPTEQRMVVTRADPARRLVKEINAEPAAAEFARILGKDPAQLDPFTFAAHPLVVRLGGTHHVRAIQRVTEDGNMVFFSAIDEGAVLTVAEPEHMVTHLERELAQLSDQTAPHMILSCDCVLRRVEAGQKQMTRDVSAVLAKHKVVGFSTYGEQIGAIHVNHTMTGVAIYPPQKTDIAR